jgi:hypothetical protein
MLGTTIRKHAPGVASPPELTWDENLFAAEVSYKLARDLGRRFQERISTINIFFLTGRDGAVVFRCEIFVLLPGRITTDCLTYEMPFDNTALSAGVAVKEICVCGEYSLLEYGIKNPGMEDAYLDAAIEITQ